MEDSRYIIGIDLGTTNIAVTFVDTHKEGGDIKLFSIPQLKAVGECVNHSLLPAFFFKPDLKTVAEGALQLPWNKEIEYCVGLFAREFGCDNTARFISSSKSWLCHLGVDRRSKILPWNNDKSTEKFSPVEITEYYLRHIREAWDHIFHKQLDGNGEPCLLSSQQVLITIPASFDETARELTLEAAKNAGYKNITLLEEPLAVFYSWLNQNDSDWGEKIAIGDKTLVIDIGGGTTDFSIIELNSDGVLSRTVAGEHLLLGGDNVDIALAKQIESQWGTHLKPNEWTALCQQTRKAKELLLSDYTIDEAEVVLLSKGSSIIGNMRKSVVKRADMNHLLDEGFFPAISVDSEGAKKKIGIQTMGLPYASDPAVSRHLLDFLRYAAQVTESGTILKPDKVLFNGGTMIPQQVRVQVLAMIREWFNDSNIVELSSVDLSLAVAYGASYCGKTKRGIGVKVKSGTARSYYIEVDGSGEKRYICIMPRGGDEGMRLHSNRKFALQANHKVSFPLYSSATRVGDLVGDCIDTATELSLVSDLVSVMKFGKEDKKVIDCELTSELLETGVLKVYIESKQSDHCWPLNFDTRLLVDSSISDEQVTVDSTIVDKAKLLIQESFRVKQEQLPSLIKNIEKELSLKRREWSVYILREFADTLLAIPYSELKSPRQESRWLNLCGFCLRPGFGDPADELRLKKVWKLWFHGMNNPNDSQTISDWWVFWRRVASGLRAGHQRSIMDQLYKQICPKGIYTNKLKSGPQAKAEMWRCAGALELITTDKKIALGKILIAHIKKLSDYEFWTLGRLGSRRMFRAGINNVIDPKIAEKWLNKLLETKRPKPSESELFAVSRIAAVCGDRKYDIDPELISKVKDYLLIHSAPKTWIEHLETPTEESIEEQAKILGDSLPLGLSIVG